MFNLPSILLGLGIAAGLYFLYLVATKGLPAAWAWVKSKWTAGQAEISKIEADLAQLESGVVADLKNRVSAIEVHVGITPPPAPAPAAQPAAAVAK